MRSTSSRANDQSAKCTTSVSTVEKTLQITLEGFARRNQRSYTISVSTVEKTLQITLEGFARRNQSRSTKSEQTRGPGQQMIPEIVVGGPAVTHPVKVVQVRTGELQQLK